MNSRENCSQQHDWYREKSEIYFLLSSIQIRRKHRHIFCGIGIGVRCAANRVIPTAERQRGGRDGTSASGSWVRWQACRLRRGGGGAAIFSAARSINSTRRISVTSLHCACCPSVYLWCPSLDIVQLTRVVTV